MSCKDLKELSNPHVYCLQKSATPKCMSPARARREFWVTRSTIVPDISTTLFLGSSSRSKPAQCAASNKTMKISKPLSLVQHLRLALRMGDWNRVDAIAFAGAILLQLTASVASFFASIATSAIVGAAIDGNSSAAWECASAFAEHVVTPCCTLSAASGNT